MVEFIEGPLWTFSLIAFCVGVLWRLYNNIRLGVALDRAPIKSAGWVGAIGVLFNRNIPHKETFRSSALVVVAGYMFHIGLLILLFWAAPHVRFLENHILGFSWTVAPYWLFIVSAAFAFTGLMMLIIRRMVDPVLRLISKPDDYLASLLVFMVMLTGCMALQEAYAGLRAFHMLWVELLMIYFPFSRLMHAFTIVFSRAHSGAVYGRKGVRL